MAKLEIKAGDRFGRLVYINDAQRRILPSGQSVRVAHCICDCGNEKNVILLHLVRNRITSCGCIRPRHGDLKTNLYNIWRGMRNRCRKNYFEHHLYFDKGINVCEQWSKSYLSFKDWALKNGYIDGLEIDRENNSKGYFPDNCRFVTRSINNLNRDITIKVNYNGRVEALSIVCLEKGYDECRYNTIYRRIRRGWDHAKAIDTPTRIGNYKRK